MYLRAAGICPGLVAWKDFGYVSGLNVRKSACPQGCCENVLEESANAMSIWTSFPHCDRLRIVWGIFVQTLASIPELPVRDLEACTKDSVLAFNVATTPRNHRPARCYWRCGPTESAMDGVC